MMDGDDVPELNTMFDHDSGNQIKHSNGSEFQTIRWFTRNLYVCVCVAQSKQWVFKFGIHRDSIGIESNGSNDSLY